MISRLLAVVTLSLLGIATVACTPEQVAVCEATPGCVEAFRQHRAEEDERIRVWVEGVQRAERDISRHPFLVCVRRHESDTSGGYQAKNSRSSASGAYQFIDSTWRSASARAGYGGYPTARSAPPWVQDRVALHVYNSGGKSAWNGSGCT